MLAYKHSDESQGLGAHCTDGTVSALLWVGPEMANRGSDGQGLHVYDRAESSSICGRERIGPAPAISPASFPTRPARPKRPRVSYRENRLVLWHSPRAVEFVHDSFKWTRKFDERRVDWVFLFGRPASDVRTEANFVPMFEGKSDSWGGHYYARDHDHR